MSRILKMTAVILVLELIISLIAVVPVAAAAGQIQFSSSCGSVGSSVTISGSSFTASNTISVTFNGSTIVTTTAGAAGVGAGTWTITFAIPTSTTPGSYPISAVSTGDTCNTLYYVVTPTITLSTYTGNVGTAVTVTGSNFTTSESVTITYDSIPVVSAFTLSTTTFSTQFTVPVSASGAHTVIATGGTSGAGTASFSVTPKITANRTSGSAGTQVTVTGSGFATSESGVKAIFNDTAVGNTVTVNTTGGWSSTFNVPNIAGGTYVIDASGNSTSAASVADLSFLVSAYINISPSTAPAGGTVTVQGYGFNASESNIIVSWDATDVTTTPSAVTADAGGAWTATFVVPSGTFGTHTIYARGQYTGKVTGPSFKVGASIAISKNSGKAGDSITVSGTSFAANETGIAVIFDGAKSTTTASAIANGAWSQTYTIPVAAGGDHTISAEGRTTLANTLNTLTFTILPDITMDKTSGPAGTSVSISATGFGSNESGITITYDGKQLGSKISAAANGTWKASVTIPASAAGDHSLQVNGSSTNTFTAGSLSFAIGAGISLNPTDGYVGSSIIVSGAGYAANSQITIFFDGTPLSGSPSATDASGNFSKSITIPSAAHGSHVIKASDAQNNNASTNFSMESAAPVAPKLSNPADAVKQGFFGGITPTFEWAKVSDPSGVFYNLQVAADEEFSDLIIDESNLTATKYTVKSSNALPRGTYFWRVQAIDGASNVGSWSEIRTLTSGMISPVAFIFIIILVIAVLAVGYFVAYPRLRKAQKARKAAATPEIIVPEVINAEYRTLDAEGTKNKALPWRLALPQAAQPKGRNLSTEDQARLRVIVDFAKSLPLAQPGSNTTWLVEIAENNSGTGASPALYSQIVKGEVPMKYEPTWMRHPTYMDLQILLEGQPILQDLNSFIDSVNRTATESAQALQDIYRDIGAEVSWDIFANDGWNYVSAIYIDSLSWFQGKYLREPSEKDYSIKPEADGNSVGLYAESLTPFAGVLIRTSDNNEAIQMRNLHLKLRRNYRNNERIKSAVTSITQLDVQRNRLLAAFNQFNKLNPQ